MQIIHSSTGEQPFPVGEIAAKALKGGAGNFYGAFSIQNFVDQATLAYTHADANGWLNYVTQFRPANFHLQDSGVVVWEFVEGGADWDDWQDTYGLDSCNAVYYSGHGGMDGNGVFFIPLGADWGGQGHYATSDKMVLGDDHTRYMFWSTCSSVRVHDGMDPIKTWFSSDRGWRMIFGFETTSVDSPDYGSNFWAHWNQGKAFSKAWLDASWAISTGQAPSVVAGGIDQNDAVSRLYNERFFSGDPGGSGWFQWTYYDRAAIAPPAASLALPEQLVLAELVPFALTSDYVAAIADRFGLDGARPDQAVVGPSGSFGVQIGDRRIGVGRQGAYDVDLATTNRENRIALDPQHAIQASHAAIARYRLNADADLVLDQVRRRMEAGGTNQGSGVRDEPFVAETTVQFRQLINGLPVITPGTGTVMVTVDNDATVTNIHSSTRAIDRLTTEPARMVVGPPPPGVATARYAPGTPDPEQRLAETWSEHLSRISARGGRPPSDVTTIPDSTTIGYEIDGNDAFLAARRLVEVGLGHGCRKQYHVVAPLVR